MNCLDCKFSNVVVRDNHDELHTICVCAESEHFLTEIDLFDSCDCGEEEREEEE